MAATEMAAMEVGVEPDELDASDGVCPEWWK